MLGFQRMRRYHKILIVSYILALMCYMCYNLNFKTTKKHYIHAPTRDQSRLSLPCEEDHQCSTLFQFAKYCTEHSNSSTDLVFLPGQHYLKSEVNIIDIQKFEMVSYSSDTSMICDKSSRFTWTDVHHVLISGITFIGCELNNVDSVGHFEIVNSTFIESLVRRTVLNVIHSNVTITNSVFMLSVTGNTQGPKSFLPGAYFSSQIRSRMKQSTWIKAVGGTIAATDKSNVIIIKSRFEGSSDPLGGVIFAAELGSKITLVNATITGAGFGNISAGVIIYAETGSILTMNNTIISDNRVVNNHGVIFLHKSSLVSYRSFYHNNLAQEGGVICAYKSKLTIAESTFTGNSAVHQGGVLQLKHSIANIYDSIFSRNTAINGGAIYSGPYSTVTVHRSTFTFNQVSNDAGAVLGDHSVLTLVQVTFLSNSAKWAGAVAAYKKTEVIIRECKFSYNRAKWGGALALHKGTITLKNSVLDHQHATQQGGAVYVNAGTLIVKDSSISYNEAEQDGGAIIGVDAKLIINRTNFMNNVATYYGAVVHWSRGNITSDGDFLVQSNTAEKGLMYLYDSSACFAGNISFIDNHASLLSINSHITFSELTTFSKLEINSGEKEKKMTKSEGHEIVKLNDLIQALQNIGDWRGLCRNLNVDEGTIDQLDHSHYHPDLQKAECLKAYFNTGNARWTEVVEAVAMYPIKNIRESKKIAGEKGLLHDEL